MPVIICENCREELFVAEGRWAAIAVNPHACSALGISGQWHKPIKVLDRKVEA